MRLRTCCGIHAPRTWLRTELICAPYKPFLDTRTFPQPRCTRIWRWIVCGPCTKSIIHAPKRDRKVNFVVQTQRARCLNARSTIKNAHNEHSCRESSSRFSPTSARAQLLAAHTEGVLGRSGEFLCVCRLSRLGTD